MRWPPPCGPRRGKSGESYQSRIWRFALDGAATRITHGPNGDYSPRYSPVDERLAFTSDRTTKGKADLFVLEDGTVRPLGDIPGTVEDLRWADDGTALFVLAADRGLDGGATNGRQASRLGRHRKIRSSTIRKEPAGASSRSTRRAARRWRSVRPISASGSSACLGPMPPWCSSPTIRASAAGIMRAWPGSISSRA